MLKKNICLWMGAALLSASSLPAQTSADSVFHSLDEVIVTATRTPVKQSQTGKVITVIDKKLIDASAGKTLPQLLQEQAGITINGAFNSPGSNLGVYMRGANVGRTLVLVDGVPVYDPSFINSEADLNLFPLFQVEKIEIARGAQSTVYGSDAVAGVINIITQKAGIRKPLNAGAQLSYGSFNTTNNSASIFGVKNKLDYSVRAGYMKTDGFSSATDKNNNGNFDDDGMRSVSSSARLGYKLSEKFMAKAYVQHTDNLIDLDNAAFTDDKDFTNNNKQLLTGGGITYSASRLTLNANYMYSQQKRLYVDDSTDVGGFSKFARDNYFGKAQFAEVFANIKINTAVALLLGTDYRYSSMDNQYLSISSYGPYSSTFADTSHKQNSVYASALLSVKRFSTEAGLRYNHHNKYGNNTTFTFNPSFSISNKWRLFGSIASAFKAPSLYQLLGPYGSPGLKAETSVNYEAGIQYLQSSFSTRAVYFFRDITNGIDFDNIQFSYFNSAEQKVQGIELETNYRHSSGFFLRAAYTYLKPEETVQSRISFKDSSYTYLLRRPAHQAHITLGFSKKALSASISGRFVGDRYDAGGYQQPDVRLNNYFLLGAFAEYKIITQLSVFVQAHNLLNTNYIDTYGYNTMPLAAQAGIKIVL